MSNKVGFISGLAVGSFDADDSFATIDLVDGNGASVSHAGHARLRFNLSTQQLEQSINTGAWIGIATGSSAGSSLAKYIIQTADASLPNAQTLSTLGTGLVKNTTGTGVLSIAIANTDFPAVSAQYIVATGTAAPPNAQNLGILTSGILKQSVSGGIATISIAVPGIDFANRVPQPGEFWIACVDQDGLTLSGNDTTGAIGIASPGQQTRVVTVTGADSAVASTKTLHFTSGGFTTNDLYGELVIGNAANAGSYRIKTVSSPTDVIVDGTIVNETFSGSVTLTVIGGPKATRDAALTAAKLTPFKTLDRLGAVLPRFGNAASLVVLARVRSGGAAYTLADLTGPSDMTWSRNLSGWAMIFFRPTDNFVNDLDDKIRSGYQILPGTNAGGYVATAGATVSNIPCQLVGGGAANIPAEVFTSGSGGVGGVIGYRLRFLSTTPTVALRNYAIMIHRSTASSVVPAKDLPAVPLPNTDLSGGDKFVIEQTAFWVFDGTLDLGVNRRVTFIGVGSTGTVGQINVECSTPSFLANFMGWEAQPAVHFGFSGTNNNFVIVGEIASDEMAGYLPSQGGLITSIQIGVGFRARLDNFNQNGLTVKASCDISDTPRTWSGSRGIQRIGPGCVFKSGVTWISSDNGLNTWGESSSESVDTISAELGNQVSSFGSDSLPGYRRTRIAAPFVSYCIGVVGGALRVRGIEIDSASASVVSIGGIGTKVVIDDIIGTGGTIVGPIIDTSTLTVTTPAYGCLAVIGTRVPITVSGTVGDIKLVDGTIVPFTTLSSIFVEDLNNNRFVGTAGFAHLATSVTGRSLNSNGKIIDIQATASGQFLRRDGNNTLGFGVITTEDLPGSVTSISGINIIAGAGLTGGGNLTTNRTIDVVAADTTITVNADSIKVNIITSGNISDNQVNNSILRDSAANSVIGRSANTIGDPADIIATASGQFLKRDGNNTVLFGPILLSDLPISIPGGTGVPTNRQIIAGSGLAGGGDLSVDRTINIGAADGTITVNADTIQVGIITTANITSNAVDNTKIRDSIATSVIGRSVNSTGDPADIQATASGQFLRRDSTSTLGFGPITREDLPGSVTSVSGVVLTAGAGLTGGGALTTNRTFDVVAADATITVNPDSIQVGVIQNANIRNAAATSVIGRSANSIGQVADITALASGHFLRRDGSGVLGFGTIVLSDLPPGITGGGGGGGDVFSTRQVIAGAGLTGGGNLTADRTFDVVAADGTIIVAADNIKVGVIGDINIDIDTINPNKLASDGGPMLVGRDIVSAGACVTITPIAPLHMESGDAQLTIRPNGLSVIGRSDTSSTSVAQNITATTSGQFLGFNGSTLAFRSLVSSDLSNSPTDAFSLHFSFGIGDGLTNAGATESNLPNGTFFTSPFWLLQTTKFSDIPAPHPYNGNPTYIDVNITHPETLNEFPIIGTFTRARLDLNCTAFNISTASGSPIFTLTMSKNGKCDSSPISISKSSVGANTTGSFVPLAGFSVTTGDLVGLRFTSSSVTNTDTVKFTATITFLP